MPSPERLIIENLFRIADKDGNDVDFILNREQALLDDGVSGRDRVPKARQLGISSYVLARFTARCLYKRNTKAVVISHDEKSTQRMLSKVHYFLNNIKGPAPKTKLSNRNEITFPKTNSVFYVGTAGARKFGRGDTISDLHCSEIAFWPDPKSLVTGLYQAVPRSGQIFEESTGNGVGNYYHRGCMSAYEGKGRFKLHFYNWLHNPDYFVPMEDEEKEIFRETLSEDMGEHDLFNVIGLSLGQIKWRREKLEELDWDLTKFYQEYPITLDECFQSSGHSLFQNVNYEPTPDWIKLDGNLWVDAKALKHLGDKPFAMGVDISGGVGKDRSVCEVIDILANRQVAELVTDRISPDLFAFQIKRLGEMFNTAFVTVESNNHGGMTLMKLKEIYPMARLYTQKEDTDRILEFGYQTTSKTKPLLVNNFRREFTDGFTIVSPALRDELSTFIETDKGTLEADSGCFDDRVMAMAVGLMGARKAHLLDIKLAEQKQVQPLGYDPFSLDGILAEFEKKGRMGNTGFPIPNQLADETRH